MRRQGVILLVGLTLSTTCLINASSKREYATAQPRTRATPALEKELAAERTITTQQRINRYFHDGVVPKLKSCWSAIQVRGKISLKYTYTKADARWVFSKLETDRSTLAAAQNALALRCMQDAVRGSSFPVQSADGDRSTFVIFWTWPVPFPANSRELVAAMLAAKPKDGESSGCDGEGTPARCFTCSNLNCIKVCVGYQECSVDYGQNGTIVCSAGPQCASGGPFGVGGGGVIY